ncbi:MAG: xanthine dehydrogenase family protein subunit M [Firmicutes bacterium]|nr:xanthine dehydrogenase family protein subunit M [Bacillota bacterium]MCL5014942.1 xanthine dehydrogenase family protein subunit M [Bacillota bacterium]
MYTAPFEYRRADTVEQAIGWLANDPENSKVLAGGHSLLPLMKLVLAQPQVLIDIGRITALKGIRIEGDDVQIGAFTTYREIVESPEVNEFCPLLAQAAQTVGDVQVRNRGTIGGSLCHADPQADMPAAVLALDAELLIEGPSGQRTQSIDGFFLAPFITSLAPGEILTAVKIPKLPAGAHTTYLKRPHPASGYPLVGVGIWLTVHDQVIDNGHIGITGIADLPFRARHLEDFLKGRLLDAATIAQAGPLAADDANLDDDPYKKNLLQVYVTRALSQFGESFAAKGLNGKS